METILEEMESLGFEFWMSDEGEIELVSPIPIGRNAERIKVILDDYGQHQDAYDACIEILLWKRRGLVF